MDAPKRRKQTIAVTPEARDALDRAMRALPGGGNYIDLTSRLVLWFEAQPLWVKLAVMSMGSGQETFDPDRARREVVFERRETEDSVTEIRRSSTHSRTKILPKRARPADS